MSVASRARVSLHQGEMGSQSPAAADSRVSGCGRLATSAGARPICRRRLAISAASGWETKFDNYSVNTVVVDLQDRSALIKALKAKMIIQNEQIRALDAYLEVSLKLLVQDEKIVNILEGMSRR